MDTTTDSGYRMSDMVRNQFVGRQDALDAFYSCFASRHMKNGIYYFAGGGQGKSWLFQKIINDNQDDPIRRVTPIIDLADSQNQSVRGLQATIRDRLDNEEAFETYEEALKRLEEAKARPDIPSSAIAGREARVNREFIECCRKAILGREVILLFDTLERVQQRYVGRWLSQEFLKKVKEPIVALAGRPEPSPAPMPDIVKVLPLGKLEQEAFAELVRMRRSSASDEEIASIYEHSGGSPLIVDLIMELAEPKQSQFITQLSQMDEGALIQESSALQKTLMEQFTDQREATNRVIWAMAYLKRRFDVSMLKYLVETDKDGKWFKPGDDDVIFRDLRELLFVKRNPSQKTHLLHDEVRRLVTEHALPYVDGEGEFRAYLYELIVNHYYPETIRALEQISPGRREPDDPELPRQLRAEQLGYILDEDKDAGLEKYKSYRAEIERETQDYDFEELLWGEVREHLGSWPEETGYEISRQRGDWLERHSLFQKAEEHYEQMLAQFDERYSTLASLGFMLIRQGKFDEARITFEAARSLVADDLVAMADIENNLGQAAERAGQWDQAADHFGDSLTAAIDGRNTAGRVDVYINRGYLYSLQGRYIEARQQEEQAITLLPKLIDAPETILENRKRAIYAWMNLGTSYRHAGDYVTAIQHYEKSMELAQANGDNEAVVSLLQHLGITQHQWGKQLRSNGERFEEACDHQLQAWQYLDEALAMAHHSDWRGAIADGLDRLARIYREIHRLETEFTHRDVMPECMVTLKEKASGYRPPLEVEYERELLTVRQFAEGNWLEKAARLFEIAALAAVDAHYLHRALESWTATANLFEELGLDDKVEPFLRRIERNREDDSLRDLFGSLSELIRANVDFRQQNLDRALERYERIYAELAKQSGYSLYLLRDRLEDLVWRARSLPTETALKVCAQLDQEWRRDSLLTRRPELRHTIERIRIEAIERQDEA